MRICVLLLLWFIVAVLVAGSSISLADEETIGYVKKIEQPAFVVRSGSRNPADIGHSVFMDDVLTTGDTGAMGITFKDNTMISIGPDTEFVVDEFVYQPRKKALSFGSQMMHGTLHYVSGTIAKLSPKSVSVKTPVGTIGIRGTRFLIKIEEDRQ
ncbi:MAG: FecR domain-containing protein [Deltaproteobacteria bacterium]|nr:FecR domain-containing protein [Deltaproteobacteria bacterium]